MCTVHSVEIVNDNGAFWSCTVAAVTCVIAAQAKKAIINILHVAPNCQLLTPNAQYHNRDLSFGRYNGFLKLRTRKYEILTTIG